ncbi:hypothetical protein DEA8626_01403 [Defluviimonas aquaemixtae]|uniref:Polyphosphate kinase-2-related domain-containing protein n=1 Tax=Albidovulum aquaemixtae TaxID=1542388 RepID=A0A2R8B5K5_9RHOB|nr:polyphosphate kinase [Defluviimonas aquaemixtae]SPH17875.1 hypothetical protein DEA8626_01403 [Defluviimonas aquaemixtae]
MSAKPRSKPRLADADMSRKIGKAAYLKKLAALQRRMAQIQHAYLRGGASGVIVFEGWDAAGKGGTIRRLSAALDPRSFKVWPIGAPRNYYIQRHYLLRFMERLPPAGAISAFDRSWYGRVLVERVEGLTPEHRWQAAYREINEFERLLIDDGVRVVKLFFHVTPEEQLARFEERLRNPMKRWKLTYEDFRNRDRWDDYAAAIDEMFARTSTKAAPWHLVPANDKKSARLDAIGHIADRLGKGVDLASEKPHDGVLDAAEKYLDLDDDLVASLRGRTE